MKKLLLTIILCLAFALPTFAENFVEIHADDFDIRYLDLDSIKLIKNDNREFYSYREKTLNKENKDISLQLVYLDWPGRHITAVQTFLYNEKGEETFASELSKNPEWHPLGDIPEFRQLLQDKYLPLLTKHAK